MNKLSKATAALEAATAEVEAIEQFEAQWSDGARRSRLKDAQEAALLAASDEAAEKNRLRRDAEARAEALKPLYDEALLQMEAFVLAAEAVIDSRAEYVDAWKRARDAGVGVEPLIPRASARAARQRGSALDLVHRFRAVNSRDW